LTGGGFGGATLILCERTEAAQVAEKLVREYSRRSAFKPQIFICQIAEGARCL
jgi:galactokinase